MMMMIYDEDDDGENDSENNDYDKVVTMITMDRMIKDDDDQNIKDDR